jgi:hypothetical protein
VVTLSKGRAVRGWRMTLRFSALRFHDCRRISSAEINDLLMQIG